MYIRLSFDYAAGCNPTENLLEHIQHNMIGKPPTNELIAIFWTIFPCSENPFAETICKYFDEVDDIKEDTEFWYGNYTFIKDYRNKMTHRNSPSITTFSNLDFDFRAPTMFVLKRAAEVYIKEIELYFADGEVFNGWKP